MHRNITHSWAMPEASRAKKKLSTSRTIKCRLGVTVGHYLEACRCLPNESTPTSGQPRPEHDLITKSLKEMTYCIDMLTVYRVVVCHHVIQLNRSDRQGRRKITPVLAIPRIPRNRAYPKNRNRGRKRKIKENWGANETRAQRQPGPSINKS